MKNIKNLLTALVVVSLLAVSAVAQTGPTIYRANTIAALQAITLYGATNSTALAFVGGGTALGDGLGGLFWYSGGSALTANSYVVYTPTVNAGRWLKLPTGVAIQQGAATAGVDTTYGWKLIRNSATNVFSIGATDTGVNLQTWDSKTLRINPVAGNSVTVIESGTGSLIVGTTTNISGTLQVNGDLDFHGARTIYNTAGPLTISATNLLLNPSGSAGTAKVIVGGSGVIATNNSETPIVQIHSLGGGSGPALGVTKFSANAAGAGIYATKSRNNDAGLFTIVQNGDSILSLIGYGDDGVNYNTSVARIDMDVNGAPGVGNIPGGMVFYTRQDASTFNAVMRITSTARVGIGTLTPATTLAVNGTASVTNGTTLVGGVVVGNTTTFPQAATNSLAILSTNAILTIGQVNLSATAEATANLNGVGTNDTVFATAPRDFVGNLVWSAYCATTNVVTLRVANPTVGNITPTAAQTWRFTVIKQQ